MSVELRRHPELVGQPVVVGGTGARGVVAAASYEARRYGVRSAMPSSVARRRCPHAVFLAGDHELYATVSRDVREIFDRYTPIVEPLSLDEAFLDVSGAATLFGDGASIAASAPRRGAGRTPARLLGRRRPQQVSRQVGVGRGEADRSSGSHRPGPGCRGRGARRRAEIPRSARRRADVGRRSGDARKAPPAGRHHASAICERSTPALLAASVGAAQARHLSALAVGHDDRAVEPDVWAKSIGHEETFAVDKFTQAELQRELVRLADGVATRLRRAGSAPARSRSRCDSPVSTRSPGRPPRRTRSTSATDLLAVVGPMLRDIDPTPGVRLLGISGSNLGPPLRQMSFDMDWRRRIPCRFVRVGIGDRRCGRHP